MVSVIITSYNQARTLELLLESLTRQTVSRFEVVIADDGSGDSTAGLCASWAQAHPWPSFKLRFVTQPDEGYRKSRILNQAIRAARGDYLVFLDADVVLERHFLADHLSLRKADAFVCGRRVDLDEKLSAQVTPAWVRRGDFDRAWLRPGFVLSALVGGTQGLKRALRVTSPGMRERLGYMGPIDLLGSNFSIWKKDLEAVNGFNEAMKAYWGEDGDLFIRLRNSGKAAVNAKGMCVQFHLFHPRREPNAEAMRDYERLLADREYKWAEKGISAPTS